jgi:hypothetical protein
MTKEIYRPTEADLVEGWAWVGERITKAFRCKLVVDCSKLESGIGGSCAVMDMEGGDSVCFWVDHFSTENPNAPKTRPMTVEEIHEKYAQGALWSSTENGILSTLSGFQGGGAILFGYGHVSFEKLWYTLPGQEPKKAEVEE